MCATLATGLGYGESKRIDAQRTASKAVRAAPLPPVVDPPDSLAVAELKNFALNALLIPLLDDAAWPNWVDPWVAPAMSLAIQCGAASVSVDGLPLVPSTPLPARAFTLRWNMDHCAILNGTTSLTGAIEFLVFHDGDRYTANAGPIDLHVQSTAGEEVLSRSFSTSMPLAPWAPP